MASVARELRRNPETVFEIDDRLRLARSEGALINRSVRDRVLERLLTDAETYAVELASKLGVTRTAIVKAVDHLQSRGLVTTRMETELPEQLKRPQQRRISLTDAGRARAMAIRTELDNEPSPFDDLWSAICRSRAETDRLETGATEIIRLQ